MTGRGHNSIVSCRYGVLFNTQCTIEIEIILAIVTINALSVVGVTSQVSLLSGCCVISALLTGLGAPLRRSSGGIVIKNTLAGLGWRCRRRVLGLTVRLLVVTIGILLFLWIRLGPS
jgi:hypothetical protein